MKTDKTSARLRQLADGLQKHIDDAFRDRLDNTPKRQRECMSARIDGNRLQRTQAAMRALADARDAGTLPAILEPLKTKAAIHPLLTKPYVHAGYYHVAEAAEYGDNSAVAVALRTLMAGAQTDEDKEAAAELARRQAIEAMEQKLRFSNIDGFFPTPPAVIDRMLDYAWEIQDRYRVLEPSAGKGDICEAVRARYAFCKIHAIEVNHSLCEILKLKGFETTQCDFLEFPIPQSDDCKYDVILMNPPFERGQDADHVRHAFAMLKPGGRLVSIIGAGIMSRSDKKAAAFRDFLKQHDAVIEDLPDESFKSAFVSTGVSTKMILLLKPEAAPVIQTPFVASPPRRKKNKFANQMSLSFL